MMNAVGLILTAICAIMIFTGSRRGAALGMLIAVCYITQGQQINVAGFHFTAIRIALLTGIVRCVTRGEFRAVQFTPMDKALIGYALSMLTIYTLRERSSDAFVYMLGCSYDIVLSYFVFRSLITSWDDANEFFKGAALLIAPLAVLMTLESMTGANVFRVMGGQGWEEAVFREGRARAVASFRGPHTAGIFGATLFPIFAGMWLSVSTRAVATIGLIATVMITFATNSSGPLLAFLSGIVALAFWPMREQMQLVRRGIVVSLVTMHLMMKAPVWYIFSKMSDITGGDGWTRSFVLDRAIYNFKGWALLGTSYTGRWLDPDSTGQLDLTDSYVAIAASGGLLGLTFYILIMVRGFRFLGQAMQVTRERMAQTDSLLWGLGATLFAHVVGLFSVSYFDQMHVPWWGFLAIVSSVTAQVIEEAPAQPQEEIPDAAGLEAEPT
ncbi:MAG: hypothetical protein U1F65_03395 [Verrucomicrobiota bacterium]